MSAVVKYDILQVKAKKTMSLIFFSLQKKKKTLHSLYDDGPKYHLWVLMAQSWRTVRVKGQLGR